MNTIQYPFEFEKNPTPKATCPSCGHPNKFRYYKDLKGNRLEDFGKCERTNSCGYHVWPTGKAVPKTEGDYTPPPEPVQIYPDGKVLDRLQATLTNQDSPFHSYAASIGISYEHLAKWRVGSELIKGDTFTAFIHEDGFKRIVNAKWFKYGPDGKRIKSKDSDSGMDSFSLKQPDEKELKRYSLCLFGEHLLDPEKKRPVMIVESEKTAVIASWFYPDYDWIAVGSANGLTDAKISALFGRRCYWLADADGNVLKPDPKSKKKKLTEGGRKNSSIRKLQAYKVRHVVLDLFPDRNDGYDIADAIRDGITLELLDQHQRQLIENQNNAKVEGNDPEADQEVSEVEPEKEETALEWENQVGLPSEVWNNLTHRKHFKKYGFIENENCYWFANKRETKRDESADDTWIFKAVSNFIIKPLLLIESKSDPKRIYQITNTYKISKVIDLDPKQFSNPSGFSEVVMSKGNFIFYGAKSHFIRITMKLFEQSKEAQEIKTLGYHPDGFYAFANGIQNSKWVPLDEHGYGIVEHGDKRYFLPAMSKIFVSDEQEYQTQKQFIYKPGKINFKDYAKKLCDIYSLNGNGRIGLLFYITALYRDIVFQNFRFFPHLYLFGPPQSGKSSLAWSTMYLFGEPRMPFMLNTGTAVAFYKQFAEFRNSVVWFDEYQNTIDYARVQSLKTAYDGAGHTKSDNTKDNRNKSIPVHSGCIISGQELPTADTALFTRCILLQFTKTEYTIEEKQAHGDFNRDIEQAGVSHLTAQLSQFRDHFKEHFMKAFDAEFALIKKHFEKRGIDDRITKNMSILLATFQVLKDKLEFPFDENELRQTAYAIMSSQNSMIINSKETSVFWKMVMYMYRTRAIKEKLDYRLETRTHIDLYVPRGQPEQRINQIDADHPAGKRILFIRLSNMHTLYQKLCRERNEKCMDESSLRHYLVNAKGFVCKAKQMAFGKARAETLAFDYDYLCESIEDFSLDDFVEDSDLDEGSQEQKHRKSTGINRSNTASDDIPF
jgi:hypothetical protein